MHRKLKRIWQRLTADRKRFGLFCSLLLVGLLLWARIIVIARPARTAVASPVVETVIAAVLTSDIKSIPVTLETEPIKNPFSVSSDVFPMLRGMTDNNSRKHVVIGSSGEIEVVSSLHLDAVMGEMAMIDGQVVQIGDIVGPQNVTEPLRLIEVQGRRVILLAGDRRYELSIAPYHR